MKTTTLLLFAEIERQQKKARKRMSKLTDALTALQSDVADLKTRTAAKEQADASTIAALQAENDSAADTVTGLSTDVKGIDAAPVTDTPAPPDVPAL